MTIFYFMPHKKIGLALGAGGSKGLAHIGIIEALEQNGINIDYIAGSSIGAMVGGFYAARKNIAEVKQLALINNWPQILSIFFDPSWKNGLIGGNKLSQFLEKYLGDVNFDELKIPLKVVSTNLTDAQAFVIDSGNVAQAIRTSVSLPILFKPVSYENKLLADGGMSLPVPVEVVRKMGADIVIAVNLYEDYSGIKHDERFSLGTITNRTVDVLSHYLARENVKSADIIINPLVGKIGLFDNFMTKNATQHVIDIGVKAGMEAIPKIKSMIDKEENIINPFVKPFQNLWRNFKKIFSN